MQNSHLKLIKIIVDFIKNLFSFFKSRKEEQNKISGEIHQEIVDNLKNKYNEIDKENESKKSQNVENRLNNLFK